MGEGPPLVNVMGWGASRELSWENPEGRGYLEGVALDRRLVIFDRRGVGASQREVDEFSLEAQVADVAAIADHLQLDRFDLWGWFDGATVTVAYSAQHPERVSRLVLWAPFPSGKEIARPGEIRSMVELIRGNWSLARRAIADIGIPSGPTELQRWWSDSLRESMSPEVAAKCVEFFASVDVRPFLPRVKAPTLVLHRRGDRNAPIRAGRGAAALIPDARFVALEGDMDPPYLGDTSYVETMTQFLDEGRAEAPTAEAPAAAAVHTILITDMEGSTTLTQRLGDAKAQEVLRTHNSIVRDALKTHSGSETKHTGDGIMASFASASKALECAIAMQRAFAAWNASLPAHPEPVEGRAESQPSAPGSTGSPRADRDAGAALEPIRVRIALNAGEPVAEEKDLFGTAVQLAARICAQAEPGQILASNVVQELAAGKGFTFADKGEATLKGFEKPVRLYEVRWRDEE